MKNNKGFASVSGFAGLLFVVLSLAGCNDVEVTSNSPEQAKSASTQFTVGGVVSGVTGALIVQNNGGDNLTLSADGAFTFPTALASGNAFSVSVLSQPTDETCVVANGTGTVSSQNVGTITILCSAKTSSTDTIGGNVVGLLGTGLVIQNDATDSLTISGNGPFTFATPLASGTPYSVSVLTPPINPYEDCQVINGGGVTGADNVNNVSISCTVNSNAAFYISGTITGVPAGETLTLLDNGRDPEPISADGAFTFPMQIPSGSVYNVSVGGAKGTLSQTCVLTNASGVVNNADVANIQIACLANESLHVTVSGLTGTGLTLTVNGGDALSIAPATTSSAFGTALPTGASYNVVIQQQPAGQNCTLQGASGVTLNSEQNIVYVNCGGGGGTAPLYSLNAQIVGLGGSGLILTTAASGAAAQTTTAIPASDNNSSVVLANLAAGTTYTVSIAAGAQPANPSQACVVANGEGTIGTVNVTVQVTCTTSGFAIGGLVSGLAGTGLVLTDNGGSRLTVTADGTFTFGAPVASGAGYNVAVATQPTGEICKVGNASGVVGAAAITNVTVTCATSPTRTYAIGGTVNGLTAGALVLSDNGNDVLTIAGNGPFTFPTPVAAGGAYDVRVSAQPTAQTCNVTNGAGTVAAAPVTTIAVICTPNSIPTFSVGGTVSGLTTPSLVLADNGGNNLTLTASGAFTFTTALARGSAYDVTIVTQPAGENCTVANGTGTIRNAAVTNVAVTCAIVAPQTYTVGGTVSGLAAGRTITLTDGSSTITVNANGAFQFGNQLPSGSNYTVNVVTPPANEICTVANAGGTITANVTNVAVSCVTPTYSVSVTVNGLITGRQLALALNGGPELVFNANASRTFTNQLAGGTAYAVSIVKPAPGENCAVQNGAGTITANVTNVVVACTPINYTIGGTISGLVNGGGFILNGRGGGRAARPKPNAFATFELELADTAGDDLKFTANGNFTFPTAVASGTNYTVSFVHQPTIPAGTETCTLANAAGTVGANNVTNVNVTCVASYEVNVTVSGLPTGDTITLSNNGVNIPAQTSTGTSFSFQLPADIAVGTTYDLEVAAVTSGEGCSSTDNTGTVNGATNIEFTCVPILIRPPPPPPPPVQVALSHQNCISAANGCLPEGLIWRGNLLYAANIHSNQVLVLAEQINSSHQVVGLTPVAAITQGISEPTAVAFDSAGFLYVANAGTNSVTIYNTVNNNAYVANISSAIGSIQVPTGIAVDSAGEVYVANNASNSISQFSGSPQGGFTEQQNSPMVSDASGHAYMAPDALADLTLNGAEALFVGVGGSPSAVIAYRAPLGATSSPMTVVNGMTAAGMSCSNGGPFPNVPSSIALDAGASASYVYVSNLNGNVVYQYPASDFFASAPLQTCFSPEVQSAGLNGPGGIAVDQYGNVFVTNVSDSGLNANSVLVYSGGSAFGTSTPFVYSFR